MNKTRKVLSVALVSAMTIMATGCGSTSGAMDAGSAPEVTTHATIAAQEQSSEMKADALAVTYQMRPMIQALNVLMDEGISYDPQDSSSYWNSVAIAASEYGQVYWQDQCKDIGDYYQIKPEVIEEIAHTIYSDQRDIAAIEIPDTAEEFIHYNKQKDVYIVTKGDVGLKGTYITGASINEDGSISVSSDFGSYDNPDVVTNSYNYVLSAKISSQDDQFKYVVKNAGQIITDDQRTSVELKEGKSYTADLNGDGKDETVQIGSSKDEDGNVSYYLDLDSEDGTADTENTDIIYNPSVWLYDIDGDGAKEVLMCGDVASDDYITYCWKYDSGLKAIGFEGEVRSYDIADANAVGQIKGFDGDGSMVLESVTNTLGSYSGTRQYVYNSDGKIAPKEDTIWQTDSNTIWMETTKQLPVTMANGTKDKLDKGTKVRVIASDGESKVWFQLKSGKCGSITITAKDDKTGWMIAGTDENDCFDMVPYAG